jgi:glycosyltransferase involved in cell wall biosynthesis
MAIGELVADPSRARAMGEAGQKHIGEHYTWNQMAARMEDLYTMVQREK